MKAHHQSITVLVCVLACGMAVPAPAADEPKPADKPKVNLPKTGQIRFDKHLLVKNKNEGMAVADVNKDGKPDLTSGPFWFEGPSWKQHPLREVAAPNDEFMANNGEHIYDLNGDGYPDVISGSWFHGEVWWFENPGQDGLAKGEKWKQHGITTGQTADEGLLFTDLDGDGVPELVPDRWEDNHPVTVVRITPGKNGSEPKFADFLLNKTGPNGHGMGIGDINDDGRKDVVVGAGWYENPGKNPWAGEWAFHKFDPPLSGHQSVPFLIVDVDGDGKTDIIYGHGHDYGLCWREKTGGEGDKIEWKEHPIDDVFSQVHCLVWTDLDGDGNMEVVTGKRFRAHGDGDPGAHDPLCLMRYEWDPKAKKFERDVISWDDGVSSGMNICVADLNGDKKPDIAVAGKSGSYVLINKGPAEGR